MTSGVALHVADACFENLQALDRELSREARKSGELRLELGIGLEVLARKGGHHTLGFPSLEAYGRERCGYGETSLRETRRLAVRLTTLPHLCEALKAGRISWSLALVLAPEATPENEARLLSLAAHHTVAGMKAHFKALRAPDAPGARGEPEAEDDAETLCTLTLTENHEDALLFECVRMIMRHLGAGSTCDVVDALIGEATSSLNGLLPRSAPEPSELTPNLDAQNAYIRQRNAWRDEAERLCEPRLPRWNDGTASTGTDHDTVQPARGVAAERFTGDAASIDAALRRISAALHARDGVIGELAERFWKTDGWRRLGYATERQYARERLGMSLSAVNDKRLLARRLRPLPQLRRAFHDCRIGYEAARIVAAVATPETDAAWAERAAERTLVHLREEVNAAKLVSRVSRLADVEPPDEAFIAKLRALESRIITGTTVRGDAESQSAPVAPDDESQKSAPAVPIDDGQKSGAPDARARSSAPAAPTDVGQISAPGPHAQTRSSAPAALDDDGHKSGPAAPDDDGQKSGAPDAQTRSSAPAAPTDDGQISAPVPEAQTRSSAPPGPDDDGQKSGAPDGRARSSAPLRARARDTLRLRVTPEIRAAYRGLERLYDRYRPLGMSFFRFACLTFIQTNKHELPPVAYAHIYRRDGLRCQNPFCTHRDLTPHHILFRSQGGDDSDENLVSLCVWCHLEGVHLGRFTVRYEDGHLVWRFGDHTVVVGRTQKCAA